MLEFYGAPRPDDEDRARGLKLQYQEADIDVLKRMQKEPWNAENLARLEAENVPADNPPLYSSGKR